MVQRSAERQRNKRAFPWSETVRQADQLRQASLQTQQPDREYVRKAQGLEACCNPLWQVPKGLHVSNRSRGHRHLLAVKFNESRP